jgi:hypothetical protein
MVLAMLPLTSSRCCKSRLVSFSRWFPQRRAVSRILSHSRVERGAERHNALMENHWRRSSGKSRGSVEYYGKWEGFMRPGAITLGSYLGPSPHF